MKKKNTRRAGSLGEGQHDGLNGETSREDVSSRRDDIKFGKDSKALTLYRACKWRDLNPDVWSRWEKTALREAQHGRRFSMQYLIEQTRKHDHVNRAGEPLVINNTHAPIWARMLATELPVIRPYIELRRSEYDEDYPDAKKVIDCGE